MCRNADYNYSIITILIYNIVLRITRLIKKYIAVTVQIKVEIMRGNVVYFSFLQSSLLWILDIDYHNFNLSVMLIK